MDNAISILVVMRHDFKPAWKAGSHIHYHYKGEYDPITNPWHIIQNMDSGTFHFRGRGETLGKLETEADLQAMIDKYILKKDGAGTVGKE